MKLMIKAAFAVMMLAAVTSSCKKSGIENEKISARNEQADVFPRPSSPTVVNGNYGNPTVVPYTGYAPVYVNLFSGAQSGTASGHVIFDGISNATIKARPGYELRFLYTIKNWTDLDIVDFPAANIRTSIGQNSPNNGTPANGWFNYVPPGGVTVIPNFYILVKNTGSGLSYALRVTNAVGTGTPTNNKGDYTIEYGLIF